MKKFYPAIDGLRAIAVLLVLFHHFFSAEITSKLLLGNFGVDIFFVISGFLITGILVSYKELPINTALRNFYFRRTLRIFPIYYLFLLIISLFFFTGNSIVWTALYAQNFYYIYHGHFNIPIPIVQFWSLAVEEQFYLVWPFIILLTPYKYLKHIIAGLVFLSVIFSLFSTEYYIKYMHPLSCVQALGLGGLLALTKFSKSVEFIRKHNALFIIAGLLIWLIGVAFTKQPIHLNKQNLFSLTRTGASIVSVVALIVLITQKPHRIMESPIMTFIGKISYGIYVYHTFVGLLLEPFYNKIRAFQPSDSHLILIIKANMGYWLKFPFYTLVTIAVAYLSFKFIEAPFLKLKENKSNKLAEAPI